MPRGVKKTAAAAKSKPLVENILVVSTMDPVAPKKGSSGLTTMYSLYLKHYLEASAKYGPKTAIFLQVGGFYELYDTLVVATGEWRANCMKLAELCSLSHAPNVSEDPAFECYCWGFPLAALEKYRAILLTAGYTVVTIVQQKSATGDVSGRVVEDVSSPGLFSPACVGGGGLIRREEQILLSVYVEPWVDTARRVPHWHMASSAFDVTTGTCVSTETDVVLLDGKPQIDTLAPFWSVYPPAEICFYWCANSVPPTEAQILSLFVCETKPLLHLYTLDPKAETGAAATRLQLHFLGETFRHSSALPVEEVLGITFYAFVRRSLFHLFQFVKDHNPSYLRLLNDHAIWTPADNVLLGNAALEQLGMLSGGGAEKENQCLLALLQKPQTAMGRRVLRERLLKPTANVTVLEARQTRIAALRGEASPPSQREGLEHILRGSFDLARLHRRFQLGSGGTEEMLQLLTTYEKAATLLTRVAGAPFDSVNSETLKAHIDWICGRFSAERIRSATNSTVGGVGNGGVAVGSCHPWTRGIHGDLDAAEDAWLAVEGEMRALRARMAAVIEDDVEAIKWELRDDAPFTFFTTGRRGAILLANAKRRLGFDITTPKKGSGGAVSIDCAAIEDANRRALAIRGAWKTAVVERWRSELHTWSTTAIDNRMFHSLVDFMGNLDADCCLARLSDEYGYVRPTYIGGATDEDDMEEGVGSVGSNGLIVNGLRHPIIERLGLGTTYVSHNLALGALATSAERTPIAGAVLREQDPSAVEVGSSRVLENTLSTKSDPENTAKAKNGILLYGVNAAGKSSLGKALGLAVLMAQAGMPVAATSMTLVPYAALFTRILGNDNLWAGMSSFVVEMTEFRSILRNAGPQTLVIGDELCAGTETASATSLVAAGVKTLADRGAHFFFATHLHELAEIPEIAGRADVGFYHLSVRPSPHTLGALLYDRILRPGTGSPMYGLEVCRGLDMDAGFLSAAFDFRRRLFSEDGKARSSVYNATVVVERCAVCGSRDRLETHHITPQAAADGRGFIGPGRHKNAADNLVCLCDGCHSDHHSGVLEISGWVATSSGRRLQFSRLG